jgi:hypothetical protein
LASGDAGGQERLMYRALRRSSMLFLVIVLRFQVYPGRLYVTGLFELPPLLVIANMIILW